jgi:hypothetical protein
VDIERPAATLPIANLLMPATWHRLELSEEGRAASIDGIVEAKTKPGPDYAGARSRIKRELERAAELGIHSGASLAYVYWAAPAGKVASASLFVALVDAAAPSEGEIPPGPAELASALAARYRGEVGLLSGGPAARVRRRGRLSVSKADVLEAEIVTWYVPHESGRRLAVLTFSTPNVELADEFGEIFDALANTVQWTA